MKFILIALLFLNGCRAKPLGNSDAPHNRGDSTHSPSQEGGPDKATPTNSPPEEESYSEVGNAGDFLAILAEEGRQYAANKLSRMNKELFPNNMNLILEPSEYDWLTTNLTVIKDDLLKSRFVWVDTFPVECDVKSCGCAFQNDKRIFLKVDICSKTQQSKHDWSKLIIHEALHHFVGNDESKAKRLGTALATVWYSLGHPDSPHWQIFKSHPKTSNKPTLSAWTGSHLAAWTGGRSSFPPKDITSYDPVSGTWSEQPIAPPTQSFESEKNYKTVSLNGLIYVSNWGSGIFRLYKISPESRAWDIVSSHESDDFPCRGAPEGPILEDIQSVVGVKDDIFAVFRCSGDTVAATFNTHMHQWRNVTEPEIRKKGVHSYVAMVTDEASILLPLSFSSDRELDTKREIKSYDVKLNKWNIVRSLPSEVDQFTRYCAHVWTGQSLIVFLWHPWIKDYGSRLLYTYTYDPSKNEWSLGRSKNFEEGICEESQALWTGTEAIIFSKLKFSSQGTMSHYNPRKDEWNSPNLTSFPNSVFKSQISWTGMEALMWDSGANIGYSYFP
jgi:hypothetical protein